MLAYNAPASNLHATDVLLRPNGKKAKGEKKMLEINLQMAGVQIGIGSR